MNLLQPVAKESKAKLPVIRIGKLSAQGIVVSSRIGLLN